MGFAKGRWLIAGIGAAGIGIGVGWWLWSSGADEAQWRTVEVQRRDVRSTVSATGTLEATTTVEVGTQVSGIVSELLVDFNDPVQAGQVVARIDTSLLEADVATARASLDVARAERDAAHVALSRADQLQAAGAAAQIELDEARTAAVVAEARTRAARVALGRAERNLAYATITSPITGTVIERAVDVGQTVNAGLSAPRLFVIAGDLAAMQILAAVDESDIGRIAVGQAATFTVQAHEDATFRGTVRQVRLQSTVEENVVTYTVVVDVDNREGSLLPGMTATVDFVVAEAEDVLCAPSAALRFWPEGEAGRGRSDTATVWRIGTDGALERLPVFAGISDGICTEISGDGISEGLALVAGTAQPGAGRSGSNPLSPRSEQRRGPPGAF